MDEQEKKNLREAYWRSKLHSPKEAELAAKLTPHPEFEAEIREEAGLNQLLDQLPDAPVASNFTSLVLQAVKAEENRLSREKRGWPAWRVGFGWVSRLAIAGFSLVLGVLTFQQYQVARHAELTQFAKSVEKVSHVATLPTEWLENFETIKHLSQPAVADEELLAMLQ